MIVIGENTDTGELVTVADEDACLVFGTPRSGKTRGIVIPSVRAHHGPCVVTSSKWDVLTATIQSRAENGPVWVFTVDGRIPKIPAVRIHSASWNPIPSCRSFDAALLHARAVVGAITTDRALGDQHFWYHHAERLFAALAHAAGLADKNMADVAQWILDGDLATPAEVLATNNSGWARSIITSLAAKADRFRESVLATASEVVRVYDHSSARTLAGNPNFPADDFLERNGTLYICIPSHEQELFAPIVVGLIDEIIRTKYRRSIEGRPDLTLCMFLDELRRIAPLHNLPGYLAESGSHGCQILGVLQDLSQARERWGSDVADGFLTLFRSKVLLPGVLDHTLLENLSTILGDELWAAGGGSAITRRRWTPHQLASPPNGQAIHIDRATAAPVRLLTA